MKKLWTQNSHRILEQASGLFRYNRWIASLFKEYFGKNILEVGSGLGGISHFLPKKYTTLSDIQDNYFNYLTDNLGYKTRKLDIEKPTKKDLVCSFDTIISSNVFEHIKDDRKAFQNCFNLLEKDGKLLLFVPSGPKIYNTVDEAMGHYRRYTISELSQKTIMAGFKIEIIKHVNLPGYFSWWLRGKFPRESYLDNLSARMFDIVIVPILYLEKYISTPFGQSLMLVAKKP